MRRRWITFLDSIWDSSVLTSLREMDHDEVSPLLEVVWPHPSRLSRGEDRQSTHRHPLPYPLSPCWFGCRLNGLSLRRKFFVLAHGQASNQASERASDPGAGQSWRRSSGSIACTQGPLLVHSTCGYDSTAQRHPGIARLLQLACFSRIRGGILKPGQPGKCLGRAKRAGGTRSPR